MYVKHSSKIVFLHVLLIGLVFTSPVLAQDDAAEVLDSFGRALVVGYFNGDRFLDLAIGVPWEEINGNLFAGAVNVLFGSENGLSADNHQFWHQDNIANVSAQQEDMFGFALAAADFNGDGYDDLAIGVPGETVDGREHAGAVNILYGSNDGLTVDVQKYKHVWTQRSSICPRMSGRAEENDHFGYALTAADFNGDWPYEDLAVGVPYETLEPTGQPAITQAGAVNVLFGSRTGLSVLENKMWNQNSAAIRSDGAEPYDYFGKALASGQFDHWIGNDLAIGAPGEDLEPTGEPVIADAGAVHVLYYLRRSGRRTFHYQSEFWTPDHPDFNFSLSGYEEFGEVLATGNFNFDQADDLVIGVPNMELTGEYMEPLPEAGGVFIMYGINYRGLDPQNHQFLKQIGEDKPGKDDRFGSAFAIGDFDFDWVDDLAIGVPGEKINGQNGAGAVNIIYGSMGNGLTERTQTWYQSFPGIEGTSQAGDEFGYALAAGNFDYYPNPCEDLAIGVPNEADIDGEDIYYAGAVNVLYGQEGTGLSTSNNQLWHQDSWEPLSSPKRVANSLNINLQDNNNLPEEFALNQNYPNPFNPLTQIHYQLPEPSFVTIKIYNIFAQEVVTIVNEKQLAGEFNIPWNGKDVFGMNVPSGTYLCRMNAVGEDTQERFTANSKLVLLR